MAMEKSGFGIDKKISALIEADKLLSLKSI